MLRTISTAHSFMGFGTLTYHVEFPDTDVEGTIHWLWGGGEGGGEIRTRMKHQCGILVIQKKTRGTLDYVMRKICPRHTFVSKK